MDPMAIYQDKIMHHAHKPFIGEGIVGDGLVIEKRNPLCGDTVRFRILSHKLVGSQARGCALCIASTSIFTKTYVEMGQIMIKPTVAWLESLIDKNITDHKGFEDDRDALSVIANVKARFQCVHLPWILAKEEWCDE